MLEKKLSKIPYGQARVLVFDDDPEIMYALKSYNTIVAVITNYNDLKVFDLYSMTTRKHISAFVNEYCGVDYSVAKRCALECLGYCIDTKDFYSLKTGEIIE